MREVIYRYARHHQSFEEVYQSLDAALRDVWYQFECGESYGKDILLRETGEVLLDKDGMMKLATMLYCDDYAEGDTKNW